jgi:hypothetical protein
VSGIACKMLDSSYKVNQRLVEKNEHCFNSYSLAFLHTLFLKGNGVS